MIVLLLDCRRWCRGGTGLVGTKQICKLCPTSRRRVTVIGEASPYQLRLPVEADPIDAG